MDSTLHSVLSQRSHSDHSTSPNHPLIVVVGPTASGKSSLSLALAGHLDGEIVNCDSIQIYRGLNIGSAKLPVAERRNIPHHLLDIIDPCIDPDAEMTAGAYARLARQTLYAVTSRGKLPILTGGTGLYLRALLQGLSPAPARNQELRNRLTSLAQRHPAALHRFLRNADPIAALRIHPNDHQKLIRAIELTSLAGMPASVTQSLPRDPLQQFRVLKIGLAPERGRLYHRINDRSRTMFTDAGLLDETAALIQAGVPATSKPLRSLGYKQAVQILKAGRPFEEAIAECQIRTRQYAKRQLTWFRADREVNWLSDFGTDAAVQAQAIRLVEKFLGAMGTVPEPQN